ncbi:MAG TPA: type II and III secretion system protein, partial [Myxococcota bacterium]|nr:type II and III secretion system protein [Myxococcota bacterium]
SGGTVSVSLIGFTLKALQTTTNVNVLSTPHILTLENEEAEIQVGKRRPYSTLGASSSGLGSLTSLLGGTTGTNTGLGNLGSLGLGSLGLGLGGLGGLGGVQYVDIDLTLKIKPTVNASDFVRMEIDQSIDDIDGLGVGDAPITSKRKVTNVVEVKDGQAVVIGGLIRDQESESVSKVPFLGDIPLVGLLFRKTTKTVEKRNLIMIIIPHVIKDPSDLKRLHEKRMEEYRTFARTMAEREKEYQGELDYRKKSGLLHDVHKTVVKARAERDLRERTLYDATDIDPVGPPETHDIEYDPRDAVKGEDGAPAPAPKKGNAPKGGR